MAKKKAVEPQIDFDAAVASIDLGNGYGKGCTVNAQTSFKSLSAISSSMLAGLEWNVGRNGHTFNVRQEDDQGRVVDYVIGEAALSQGTLAYGVEHRGRIETPQYRLLFAAALTRLIPYNARPYVIVSLPPKFFKDKDRQRQFLSGVYRISAPVKGQGMVDLVYDIPVENIRVIPEGLGALATYIFTPEGEYMPKNDFAGLRVGVIDVGTYTTDLVMLDHLNPVENKSESLPRVGVGVINESVANFINDHTGSAIDKYQVEPYIADGYFLAMGERLDLKAEIGKTRQLIAEAIIGGVISKWDNGYAVDRILISGGGAKFVQDIISDKFPHAGVIRTVDPFFANAEGALRFELFKLSPQGKRKGG